MSRGPFYGSQQGKELLAQRDFEGRAEEFKSTRIRRLIGQNLPACVIAERVGCSEHLVLRVVADLGVRLPTFRQWDELNAC